MFIEFAGYDYAMTYDQFLGNGIVETKKITNQNALVYLKNNLQYNRDKQQ